MGSRNVGSGALDVPDWNPADLAGTGIDLLRLGVADHAPPGATRGHALLGCSPTGEKSAHRGAFYTLTAAGIEPVGGQAGPILAAEELARAHYGSLAQSAGQAQRSAVDGALRHLGTLTHAIGAPDLAFVTVAVQGGRAWIAKRGEGGALVLRVASRQWAPL